MTKLFQVAIDEEDRFAGFFGGNNETEIEEHQKMYPNLKPCGAIIVKTWGTRD